MPAGLDIDRSAPLDGTMAAYSRHILVLTGQSDWKSKIEDERDTAVWGRLLAGLKKEFGRGGNYHDVSNSVRVFSGG
jgi:prenyl protein peptidase